MRRIYPDAKIKPCPFCGHTEIHFHEHPGAGTVPMHRGETVYTMACQFCAAQFPGMYRVELLVEKWNARVAE
jgi:Lar family restriction alleviation protein